MMRKKLTLFFLLVYTAAFGQDNDKLFGPAETPRIRHGFLINVNGDFDIPAGNIAKEFGPSYRIGPAGLFKTKQNWLIGAKCDFILGNIIKQDSLMINITDRYSAHTGNLYEFINNQGQREGVPVYERGYIIALQAGKIISVNKNHPDNGIILLTSGGFMQYKIDIYDKDKTVTQLQGQYLKGYDRLTNGFCLEQYAGYAYFSKNKLINFTYGLDGVIGFTQDRRSYLYDVMRADNTKRVDVLVGIRAGWFLPIYKRKSEELNFQ